MKHIPLARLSTRAGRAESRDVPREVPAHRVLSTYRYDAVDYREIEELFLHGKAKIALVLPIGFGRDLLAGSGGARADAGGRVRREHRRPGDRERRAHDAGLFGPDRCRSHCQARDAGSYVPLDFQPRIWYNPDLVSRQFLVPGLIGLILVLTAVVSTSLTVVREKERGTMEQIMVSPLRPLQVILGKTIPYLLISLVAATAS